MLSKWARTWDGRLMRPALLMLARLRVTPDALTLASVVAFVFAGLMFAMAQLPAAAIFIALGGILDSLDGELARATRGETRLGSFLDSICDHYGDFAAYLGLLWLYLAQDARLQVFLIFISMFGSVVGSHIRSRAGMLGIDTRWAGAFTRLERSLVLIIGALIGQLPTALAILAVMNNVSAAQRIAHTVRLAHAPAPSSDALARPGDNRSAVL